MENFLNDAVVSINDFLWGYVLIFLLVGTGIFLTIRTRGIQLFGLGHGVKLTRGVYDKKEDAGDLSHFQALTTALSATVGVGNIAGVAIAIKMGGPGALFWMWVTAAVGMATKFTSCTLAVKYRKINEDGTVSGGPMYFIENGLGQSWKPLAAAFAVFATVGTFGAGCMAQAGELSRAFVTLFRSDVTAEMIAASEGGLLYSLYLKTAYFIQLHPTLANFGVGVVVSAMVAVVILGGIKRIGNVTSKLVPFMAVFYVTAALTIIIMNMGSVPAALVTVFSDAFTGTAAAGGFTGATFILALKWGVKRGLFSNESGQGSAPIAHATAKTNYPAREGYVALLEPFIDTIIICSLTGLVIIITGAWTAEGDIGGADMTAHAFQLGLGKLHNVAVEARLGRLLVTFGVILFAYSTALSWSYYGDRCIGYLFGLKAVVPYRVVFCLFLIVGATIKIDLVWNLCDLMNGAMALPNLIALILLSGVVVKELNEYKMKIPDFDREISGKINGSSENG